MHTSAAQNIKKLLFAFGLAAKQTKTEHEPAAVATASMPTHKRIQAGFPSDVIEDAKEAFGLSVEELAKLIGVSAKTIYRKLSQNKSLSAPESDRFYRSIRLFLFASEVFNNPQAAAQWMDSPQPALGSRIPKDLLQTEAGAEAIHNLLGRIKYGVIS